MIIVSNLVTSFLAIDRLVSFKYVFSFALEQALFFVILCTSLRTVEDIEKLLLAACAALGIAAFIGVLQYYEIANIPSYLPVKKLSAMEVEGIRSTFPHRILFGTAMSMGWPLAIVLADKASNRLRNGVFWVCCLLMIAAVYFSMSRGAWLSSLIGAAMLFMLGCTSIKKALLIVLCMVLVTLVLRPGVFSTVEGAYRRTLDFESVKGKNVSVRLKLWEIAYFEISKSVPRLLFGYGLNSHVLVDPKTDLKSSTQAILGDIRWMGSWDNHYAATLFDQGVVGLFFYVLLYFSISKLLFPDLHKRGVNQGELMAPMAIWAVVMLFMMTNVSMFSPQLKFMLWISAAAGVTFRRVPCACWQKGGGLVNKD
jgi:hypothetical protein